MAITAGQKYLLNKMNSISHSVQLGTLMETALAPTHKTVFAGTSAAENDADGTLALTLTGLLATDVVSVVLRAATNDVYVKKAVPTANTLTVTLSGAGGAGTQVDYVVLRAN